MQLIAILDAIRWAIPGVGVTLPAGFRAFSQAAAPLVATALWQGVAVAAALAVCLRLAPRMSAAHRFALWIAGFIALVCLPFIPLLSHLMAASAASASAGLAETAAQPWLQLDIRWSLAIAALWAATSLFRAADLAVHSFRLGKLWKTALPVEPDATLTSLLVRLTRVPGRRPVQICTTQQLDRPSVIGFFAPRILIPDWLLSRLTPGELQQIVLHEAEHLRRGDDWTNFFQKLCLVLFPLNPALWWIERRLCQEREMACDDAVIRVTHAPRAYAACLASLAERGLQRRIEALSLGAWQQRPELVHRVHSILARSHALSPLATRALLGALSCSLVLGSVELARCPQLIAFVPAHAPEVSQAVVHSEPPRLLNAAYAPVHKSRTLRAASGFRAMNTAAILPPSRPSTPAQASLPRPATGATKLDTSATQLASNTPKELMLKAEMPGRKPNANHAQQEPQPQQWIVLATWEQVQTTSQALPSSSDYESDPPQAGQGTSNAAGQRSQNDDRAATQNNGQATTQITVSRLIFRLIPVRSISTRPAPLPVPAGWLVLQL